MSGLIDLKGQKFNRLLVLERAENLNNNRNARWKCLCDCGNIRIVFGRNLKNGNTLSCGCYSKEQKSKLFKKPDGDSSFHKLFDTYMRNAKNRNLTFEINEIEFKILVDGNCFYCGVKPSSIQKNRTDRYIYNGIDRIDNTKGYIIDNIVTCCSICNNAKRIMPQNEFFKWVKDISLNLIKKGLIDPSQYNL